MSPVSPQEPPQKLLSTSLVPAHVNVEPAFFAMDLYGPNTHPHQSHGHAPHAPDVQLRPGVRIPSVSSGLLLRRQIIPSHEILSAAATWLSTAAFHDNSRARDLPSVPLKPDAFASSDSLTTDTLI
jgi:hypothetical protein